MFTTVIGANGCRALRAARDAVTVAGMARVRAAAAVAIEEDSGAPSINDVISASEAEDLARVFKALADPVRLRLLSMISSAAEGEVCVCYLTDAFDVTAPTISYHLKMLRTAGLITGERRGTWVYYRVVPETLARLGGLLDQSTQCTSVG